SAARGFPTAEPEDVANTIVELLQTGKFELYVPRSTGVVTRLQALVPRRVTEAIIRWTRSDQLLLAADRGARAAYEERMTQMINSSAGSADRERTAA
ncbi:MAG: short-chain dehydrogenase, partial [Solirubrobacterales bacterium]|nr:short-chain dehydrogenase [Solirubrobacterales bacterium]